MTNSPFAGLHPTHDYGDTAPLLKIAKKFGVPYEIPLALADVRLHHRSSGMNPGLFLNIDDETLDAISDAVHQVTKRTKSMWAYGDRVRAGNG